MAEITFEEFPKISRIFRDVTIMEKIDGTNAQVIITDDGQIGAASRNRLITPEDDNYGFAAWVRDNKNELMALGPGRHFGEWWGRGVGRNYSQTYRRFSLFNTKRWAESRPACCDVVPVLYSGTYKPSCIHDALRLLRTEGSQAAPGFMKPEGIVMWHDHARTYFKATLENDEMSKGEAEARAKAQAARIMAIIWTVSDEKRLISMWKARTIKQIAEAFGKSDQAIRDKARRLGLRKPGEGRNTYETRAYKSPSMPFVPIGRD